MPCCNTRLLFRGHADFYSIVPSALCSRYRNCQLTHIENSFSMPRGIYQVTGKNMRFSDTRAGQHHGLLPFGGRILLHRHRNCS